MSVDITDEIIERAAVAIYVARMGRITNHDNDWGWVTENAKDRLREQAKAALSVLKEFN